MIVNFVGLLVRLITESCVVRLAQFSPLIVLNHVIQCSVVLVICRVKILGDMF